LTPERVRVWDPVVRATHWGLVLAFPVAYMTHGGYLFAHRIAGYAVLALLATRLAWGFVGPETARFASFVPGPRRLAAYLAQLTRGREPRFVGHNPAGGAMIAVLLALLAAVSATGLVLDTPAWRDHRGLQAVHDALSDGIVACVLVHLVGVAYASWRHRENLVAAMVTGMKRRADGERP
jgi:cytochrome b